MVIETKAFGKVEIDDAKVVKFVGPMLGFEGASRFVLLDPHPESPFKVFQLADRPEVCFLVTDPAVFFPQYKLRLSPDQVTDVGLSDPAKAAVLVVVTVHDGGARLTANLLGPLVVNAETFRGKQLVLKGSAFRVDEPLPISAA